MKISASKEQQKKPQKVLPITEFYFRERGAAALLLYSDLKGACGIACRTAGKIAGHKIELGQ